MSSSIFNMLTNLMLEKLPPEVGIKIVDKTTIVSAWDNVNLCAATPKGLQTLSRLLGVLSE